MRKVIQMIFAEGEMYYLCDDGSIWVKNHAEWMQVDGPPTK